MNIQLILPDMGLSYTMNHGVTAIAGAVKQSGHDCRLLHIKNYDLSDILNELKKNKPDLIGISLTENHNLQMGELTNAIKSELRIKVFWGGAFPSAFPNVIEEWDGIDGLCRGEGEESFIELLSRIDSGENFFDVEGFWFRDKGRIIKNPRRKVSNDLDLLPMPCIPIHPYEAVMNYPAFSFSRGCPFQCTYCCAPLYQKWEESEKHVRYKSPVRAIKEINDFLKRYKPDVLYFDDDTFFKSRKWLKEFIDLYKKDINYPFVCNTRPETINEETVSLMKEANCQKILIGIESGSQTIRQKVLGRRMDNETIMRAFDIVKKYGIKTSSFNMVGIPGETLDDHMETVKLNQKIAPDEVQITIFYPYRGTKLGDEAYAGGFVKEKGYPTYFGKTILDFPDFSKDSIEKASRMFKFRVYKSFSKRIAYKLLLLEYLKRYPRLFRAILSVYHKIKSVLGEGKRV